MRPVEKTHTEVEQMSEKKTPEKKVKVGRISISVWRRRVEKNGAKMPARTEPHSWTRRPQDGQDPG